MFNTKSTNVDINQHDWAQRDRAALLRSLHVGRAPRAPAAASSGWGADLAGSDPRSVHAYLSGKGDLRTTWWNLFSAVYMAMVPRATLERAMYAFHRFHHTLTLSRLEFANTIADTASNIAHDGLWSAARSAAAREVKR